VVRGSDNTQSVVYMYSQPGKYIHQVNQEATVSKVKEDKEEELSSSDSIQKQITEHQIGKTSAKYIST